MLTTEQPKSVKDKLLDYQIKHEIILYKDITITKFRAYEGIIIAIYGRDKNSPIIGTQCLEMTKESVLYCENLQKDLNNFLFEQY